jgi:hypothetical protein
MQERLFAYQELLSILRTLDNHPLLSQAIKTDPEVLSCADDLRKGEVILFHRGNWHLGVASGEKVGNVPLVYEGNPQKPRSPIFFHETSFFHKIGYVPNFIPPELLGDRAIYSNHLDRKTVDLHEIAKKAEIYHICVWERLNSFYYQLKIIRNPQDIIFRDPVYPILKDDYLAFLPNGVPFLISDFHHKIPYHIRLLTELGLLDNLNTKNNNRPLVDWVDKHFDDAYLAEVKPEDIADAKILCKKYNCGAAATLIAETGIADVRYFSPLATTIPQHLRFGQDVNPFFYHRPFARAKGRIHLLSFETDILQNYVSNISQRINEENLDDLFLFLYDKGINQENYDAVLVYTGAPYWCSTDLARAGIRGLWEILN